MDRRATADNGRHFVSAVLPDHGCVVVLAVVHLNGTVTVIAVGSGDMRHREVYVFRWVNRNYGKRTVLTLQTDSVHIGIFDGASALCCYYSTAVL